jgi:hypothetical protein
MSSYPCNTSDHFRNSSDWKEYIEKNHKCLKDFQMRTNGISDRKDISKSLRLYHHDLFVNYDNMIVKHIDFAMKNDIPIYDVYNPNKNPIFQEHVKHIPCGSSARCFYISRMNLYNNNDDIKKLLKKVEVKRYDCGYTSEQQLHIIQSYIDTCISVKMKGIDNLRRGDLISLFDIRYRNDHLYIWDGNVLEDFDYVNYDEYGAIPTGFNVLTEFPIQFWHIQRAHNNMVHFQYNMIDCLDNLIMASNDIISDGGKAILVINVPI